METGRKLTGQLEGVACGSCFSALATDGSIDTWILSAQSEDATTDSHMLLMSQDIQFLCCDPFIVILGILISLLTYYPDMSPISLLA